MAITHKYTLICDDVRREDNGKLMIIGMYTGTIGLPQIPYVLPSLTFFTCVDSDRPGHWSMKFRIHHLETGANIIEGHGAIVCQQPGPALVPIRIAPLQFQAVGAYNFVIDIEEHREPIVTDFNVLLLIPTPMSRVN
jgi:hypothetical protein